MSTLAGQDWYENYSPFQFPLVGQAHVYQTQTGIGPKTIEKIRFNSL